LELMRDPKTAYGLTTVVKGEPIFLDGNAASGAWSWTVRMPVLLSLVQTDPEGVQHTVSSSTAEIVMVISRVPGKGGPDMSAADTAMPVDADVVAAEDDSVIITEW